MKKSIITAAAVFAAMACSAQWVTLNSTTSAHLHDVDFINANEGVIVGDGGTVLYSSDGGQNWTDINNHGLSGDVYSVSMISTDTIYVSTFDIMNTEAVVYLTVDGGANWAPVAVTSTTNHKFDLEPNIPSHLFATGTDLLGTTDMGTTWDTLYPSIAGTTSMDHLRFADSNTGHVSGLVSGFITYSAVFARTEDGGANWYAGDVFSFPNSDAFTTMCFVDADTAYMFTNHYNGFSQGTQNGMVKLFNFTLTPSSFDTTYTFSSTVVNATMPCYSEDAFFSDANNGFVAGQDGNVYRTIDGGANWTVDYTGSSASPMHKMKFTGTTGYAVGDNGVLIKYTAITTSIAVNDPSVNIGVYPNPAHDRLVIHSAADNGQATARMLDVTGKEVAHFTISSQDYVFDAAALSAGVYFLEYTDAKTQSPVMVKWVKQ